jgi:hypothetical protein
VRIFLSFHSPDRDRALALKAAIEKAKPNTEVFVDQTGLRLGHLWQPALFDAIAKSAAFIILVSNQLGDWQTVEYYEARDRKAKDDHYVLLPIIVADKAKGPAANLPGLAQLNLDRDDRTDGAGTARQNRRGALEQSGRETARAAAAGSVNHQAGGAREDTNESWADDLSDRLFHTTARSGD